MLRRFNMKYLMIQNIIIPTENITAIKYFIGVHDYFYECDHAGETRFSKNPSVRIFINNNEKYIFEYENDEEAEKEFMNIYKDLNGN